MTAREVLDGINSRLAAATPGPWAVMDVWDPGEGVDFIDVYAETDGLEMVCRLPNPEEFEHREPLQADAAFIAAAPVDVARLTRAVEAVLEVVEARAATLRNTADRLNRQCLDRDPERDYDAAIRYEHYALDAESMRAHVTAAIENALNP